jgi:hypothetical protein
MLDRPQREVEVKLLVRHTFPCTVEAFWTMFWDPAYDQALQAGTSVVRELIDEHDEGPIKVQQYRFTPAKQLPGPIARLAGSEKFTYEQTNRFDPATGVMQWKVVPSLMPDKITAEGTFQLREVPEGCERTVEGKIEVRVPLVGGRIEAAIISDVETGYEGAAEITRQWHRERH